jgi:hypothetical protein
LCGPLDEACHVYLRTHRIDRTRKEKRKKRKLPERWGGLMQVSGSRWHPCRHLEKHPWATDREKRKGGNKMNRASSMPELCSDEESSDENDNLRHAVEPIEERGGIQFRFRPAAQLIYLHSYIYRGGNAHDISSLPLPEHHLPVTSGPE